MVDHTNTQPAFAPDMPERDYRAYSLPSWSSVKGLLDTCPAEWLHQQNAPRTESAAMIWGTLLHAAVLEPHRLDGMVCIPPEVIKTGATVGGDRGMYTVSGVGLFATKAEAQAALLAWTHTGAGAVAWRTQAEAQADVARIVGDRYAVTAELLADLRERAEQAAALLPGGDSGSYEVAMRGSIEGQPCKGKADIIDGTLILRDVKTTTDVSPKAIQRAATDRHWFGQLWTYGELARQNGHAVDAYGVLVVQAPHLTYAGGVLGLSDRYQPRPHARIVPIGVEGVAHGRAEAIRAWRTYLDCTLRDHWPDWSETHPGPLVPSRWAVEAEPEAQEWT